MLSSSILIRFNFFFFKYFSKCIWSDGNNVCSQSETFLQSVFKLNLSNKCHLFQNLVKTIYLYIKNLKYTHLTPIFRQHNIHLVSSTCQHKYKWIVCTEKPVLNASFQDFWCTNIIIICFVSKKTDAKIYIYY